MKKLLLVSAVAIGGLIVPSIATAQITTFPHSEDFEAFPTTGTSCTTTSPLQDGWVNGTTTTTSTIRDFLVDIGGTSSLSTGPSTDYNPGTSTGKYLYAETSSPCFSGSNIWLLESPTIDLTGTNNIQFTFWYHMYGQSMGTAHVDVTEDGGATWTLDVVPAWTDNQDLWQQQVVSLGAFSGMVKVRIRYEDPTDFYGDMAIDDVLIYDLLVDDAGISAFVSPAIPTCNFNDSVSVELTNFGTDPLTSVNINWSWTTGGVPTAQPVVAWTGSLPSGASETVFLGTVPYGIGDDLIAWTDMPNGVTEIPSGSGNDNSALFGLSTGLSGTYTIGATGDYADFNSAVSAINTFGVCGPVVFEVMDGIYSEQFVLGPVIGMDATNRVTFRGQSGDPALAILTDTITSSTANYIIALNDADFYTFEDLTIENQGATYGRVFDFQGGSDWNTITGCHLISTSTTTSTFKAIIYSGSGNNNEYNTFTNNLIEGGAYGLYYYGVGTSSLAEGTVFEGNEILNSYYMASYFYYMNNLSFKNNYIHGSSSYTGARYGGYFNYCDGGFEVTGNRVYGDATGGYTYGLYFSQCDGLANNRGLAGNNMVQVGLPGSTSTMYGIYLSNSGNMDVHSNNVLVSEGGASSRAFYATSGGATRVMNNNFVNYTSGYGAYIASSFSISDMDGNNLHSPGGNIGYFNGDQLTLGDWQAASGYDMNSMDNDPLYHGNDDLHVCADTLDGAGVSHPDIAMDIDGQVRGTTPDLGADEFSALSSPFLGPDISLCTGDSVMLSAGSPTSTILWSTGETSLSIWVSTPGTYDVSLNGVCGSGSDTIVVASAANVYTGYLVADTLWFCTGGSAMLTSNMMADSYTWTGGSTNDTLIVTTGGTYTLDITDACGSGSESITIDEYSTPVAGFTSTTSFATAIFTNTTTGGGNTTYSWDFGDGNSSSATDPIHAYGNTITYTVTLTATNECGTDTFTDTVTLSTIGLEDLFLNGDVSVYPNPSKGEFTIDMTVLASSDVTVEVENILGAIVYESTPGAVQGNYSENISLGNAPAGMYFVRVTAGKQQLVKKIVIE